MEPAGLAAGVLSLAGLFSNAVDCFEYVQIGRNLSKDFQTRQLKLDNARLRLSRWGEAMGLSGDMGDSQHLQRTLGSSLDVESANARLEHIIKLFADAAEVSSKFETGTTTTSAHALACNTAADLEPAAASLHHKMNELSIRRQNKTSLKQRAKWALHEEKHFTRLVEDITVLVNGLTELFPGSKQTQQVLCEGEVAELGHQSVPLLENIVNVQDKDLEAAMVKALEKTGTQSSKVVFSGQNNSGFQMGFNSGTISDFTFGRKEE